MWVSWKLKHHMQGHQLYNNPNGIIFQVESDWMGREGRYIQAMHKEVEDKKLGGVMETL